MPSTADSSTGKKRIQAVQTSIDIIDTIREKGGAGVTEISKTIDISKGTVHNHLATLEENRYVVKTDTGDYHLGLQFIDVAHHAKSRVPILDLARTEVDKLAESSGEMALFTVEEHGLGVCLHVAYGEQAVQTPLYIGQRSELHHTAVGKAILAHLSPERVDEILERRGLPQETEHTITDRAELLEQLEVIREEGIAHNEQETFHGLVGVGAPIQNQNGEVTGALSIIGPARRLSETDYRQELIEMIKQSVNIIEVNSTAVYDQQSS